MKIALIFLVACFIGLSYQQQRWVPYPIPHEFFYPSFYAHHPYAQSRLQPNFALFEPQNEDQGGSEIEGRVSSNQLGSSPYQRFLIPNFFSAFNQLISYSTTTRTVYTVTTLTTTVAAVQSCILSGLFVSNAATCSRRRRDVMADLLTEVIAPSQVEPLIPTQMPTDREERTVEQGVLNEPEIASSLEDREDDRPMLMGQPGRQGRALTTTTTTTSTVTSYSFVTTTLKKFFSVLGTSTSGNLACIPPGFTAC